MCIFNGADPSNNGKGIPSLEEPTHTDLQPRLESDGYIWKYLYTIKPSEIIKFDTEDFMSVPSDYLTSSNTADVRSSAVDGKIEVIVIENTLILCEYLLAILHVYIQLIYQKLYYDVFYS